jgi:hypothetical protein
MIIDQLLMAVLNPRIADVAKAAALLRPEREEGSPHAG